MPLPVADIAVVAPNLKRRLSGVTATVVRLVPVQAQRIGIVTTGPGLPPDLPHIPLWRAATLPRDRWRVWHARRNTEMLLGLALRHLLRRRYRLLFTSASQRIHSRYTRALIARMDAVVATSAAGAAYLERQAQVIHHGIDTDRFVPAADRAALRSRLGLRPDAILIGCFGRIRPQKGTGDLVEAMLRRLPAHPGEIALVMGRATGAHTAYRDRLRARVADAGLTDRIIFLPEVPVTAMQDWYAALDLYVAPQRWEGFGLTPLEAMAVGTPVVATRVGAFPELVAPSCGALVPPEDPEALDAALARWLDDPACLAAARTAARAHVEAHHGIEAEAEALIALYRRMLA